jgi:hypothetical protein
MGESNGFRKVVAIPFGVNWSRLIVVMTNRNADPPVGGHVTRVRLIYADAFGF